VIASTEVRVDGYDGDKISLRNGIFVPEWFLKKGSHEDFALMLLSRLREEKVCCQVRLIC
jgi:hypothetical protein